LSLNWAEFLSQNCVSLCVNIVVNFCLLLSWHFLSWHFIPVSF
jgi:hypothetical protein